MTLKEEAVDWAKEFNGAITVCDRNGIIVYMNQYAICQFTKYGGEKLLGTNLLECHPEPSKTKLKQMLKSPVDNMYTTESAEGQRKIIYQTPWKINGKFCGIIEISFLLDSAMPHFKR